MNLFTVLLTQPLFNLLIWLYNVIPGADLGFAIIALTALVRIVLWPLSHRALKSQKRLQDLQPKMDALKAEFKDNKEGMAKATMELYKSEKVNPLSSCLPLLIQLPIIWALYQVLHAGALGKENFDLLYSFVDRPESINHIFLGFLDLSKKNIPMAVVAGLLQFVQTKMLIASRPPSAIRKAEGAKDEDMAATLNKSMLYTMPVMTAVIGATLPAGLTLYWVVINVLTIAQQYLVFRKKAEKV